MSRSGTVIQGVFQGGQPLRATNLAQRPMMPKMLNVPRALRPNPAIAQLPGGKATAFALPNLPPVGSGQPMPNDIQERMESAFRTDFSDVRIHIGPQAASIGALAYTHDSHIHFAPGQYNPRTPYGQKLLGHELTHVLQQRAGRVRNPFGGGVAVVQDPTLEAEADRMGMRAAAFPTPAEAPTSAVQRKARFQVTAQRTGHDERKLFVMADGKQIGSAEIRVKNADTAELVNLSVDPPYRGVGAGDELLRSAKQVGHGMGKPHLRLESEDKGSGRLTAWYQRQGFKATGISKRGNTVLQASLGHLGIILTPRHQPMQLMRSSKQDAEYVTQRTARRKAADELPTDTYKLGEPLAKIASKLYSGSTESTLAVGLTTEKTLVVVKKGGTVDQAEAIRLANEYLGPLLLHLSPGHKFDESNVTIETSGGEHGGKHAEMILWKKNGGQLLAVGASQAICVDCGGFLNQKKIEHAGCETGDGRKYWWDPEKSVIFSDNIKTDGIPTISKAV